MLTNKQLESKICFDKKTIAAFTVEACSYQGAIRKFWREHPDGATFREIHNYIKNNEACTADITAYGYICYLMVKHASGGHAFDSDLVGNLFNANNVDELIEVFYVLVVKKLGKTFIILPEKEEADDVVKFYFTATEVNYIVANCCSYKNYIEEVLKKNREGKYYVITSKEIEEALYEKADELRASEVRHILFYIMYTLNEKSDNGLVLTDTGWGASLYITREAIPAFTKAMVEIATKAGLVEEADIPVNKKTLLKDAKNLWCKLNNQAVAEIEALHAERDVSFVPPSYLDEVYDDFGLLHEDFSSVLRSVVYAHLVYMYGIRKSRLINEAVGMVSDEIDCCEVEDWGEEIVRIAKECRNIIEKEIENGK